MQRREDWIKKLELKILSKRNLVPDIVLFIRGEEKFHGKLNAISREENYLRLGPKTLEWFPLCPFISPPRVPFDQEKIDRSNFSLFLFFFFLSLSPRVVSCTFNVLSPKIYIYIHSVYPSSITTTCSGFFGSILVPKGDGEMEATQSLRSEWIIAYNL